jgi:hypothetical protein
VRGAARRIATLVAVVLGATACASALVGLLAGASLSRAVSAGFYVVGCFLVVLGFFSGVRGPVRPKGREEDAQPLTAPLGVGIFWSGVRTATADEHVDAMSTAWLFLVLGLGLVVVGVLVDSRVGFT